MKILPFVKNLKGFQLFGVSRLKKDSKDFSLSALAKAV